MKSFLLCTFLLGITAGLTAQQLHFVYLQTDSRKPFYVSLNQKNYSSSSIGYIILPKLQNGDYPVRIGFPKTEEAEKEFLLQVRDNDQGFLIKDFGDKGWGLFNLQSMNVQYAGLAAQKSRDIAQQKAAEAERLQKEATALQAAETERRNDSLKAIASNQQQEAEAAARKQQAEAQARQQDAEAVARQHYADSLVAVQNAARQHNYDDSMQKAASIAATEKNRNDRKAAAAREKTYTDSLNKAQATALENERLEKIADSEARAQAAAIEKKSRKKASSPKTAPPVLPVDSVPPHLAEPDPSTANSPVLLQKTFTDTGWRYAYAITNRGRREMIDVFIPSRQPQMPVMVAAAKPAEDSAVTIPETTISKQPVEIPVTEAKPESTKKEDPKFLNTEVGEKKPETTLISYDTARPDVKVLHNSNCRAMASDKDFLNARKKIVSAEGTENMVAAARKFMKEKCFTTEQVRNLSFLFLTDADRYQFLDAAYPFALDAYRYSSLQDLLKDEYYIQRFKAMIR